MRFRRKAREHALLVMYRWDMRGENPDQLIQEVSQERKIGNPKVKEYTTNLVKTTLEKLPEIDSMISEHLQNWDFDRLGYIERNALRLGIAELLYLNPPDPGRVFNDFVSLVKKFADAKAGKFVNGVMSKVYKTAKRSTSSAKK